MQKYLIPGLLIGLACGLGGCSRYHYDYAPIDPPEQNQWFTIRGKLPPNVTGTLVPKYSSSVCMRPHNDGNGNVSRVDGITDYEITILPEPDGSYQGRVYLHGGSRCDWQLYDILFFAEAKSVAPYQAKLPPNWQSIKFETVSNHETVHVYPDTEQLAQSRFKVTKAVEHPLRLKSAYYPFFTASFDPDNHRRLFFDVANSSPDLPPVDNDFIYPTDGREELGVIEFSPTVDMDYVVYEKYTGSQVKKNNRSQIHYPNGDVAINEYDPRPYRYYEQKKEKDWGDEIIEKLKKQGGGFTVIQP
ncbi:hypothetical protein [Pseudaeromonas paramecii]|uniref:Lipoprotein n=1 Tax=Pseudaeromonas paramecii TaxID=2138166 RepID=A0ABP8Q5U0_9GAMM